MRKILNGPSSIPTLEEGNLLLPTVAPAELVASDDIDLLFAGIVAETTKPGRAVGKDPRPVLTWPGFLGYIRAVVNGTAGLPSRPGLREAVLKAAIRVYHGPTGGYGGTGGPGLRHMDRNFRDAKVAAFGAALGRRGIEVPAEYLTIVR